LGIDNKPGLITKTFEKPLAFKSVIGKKKNFYKFHQECFFLYLGQKKDLYSFEIENAINTLLKEKWIKDSNGKYLKEYYCTLC